MYQCPICQQGLVLQMQSFRCPAGHTFDRAREGYVNLLPVQQKNSLAPGDNSEMMQARRTFLEQGHYQPLSDAVNQLMQTLLKPADRVLDIGCGEGYYTSRLANALSANTSGDVCGLDISKTAVRAAAKRYPKLAWCVASAHQLPYSADYFAAVLRIYAPSKAAEIHRVLQPNGYLVTVTPAPNHLVQLKQAAYQQVRLHSDAIMPETGFRHQQRQRLNWHWQAPNEAALAALMAMTPLAYKLSADVRQQLCASLSAIELDFYLDLYQKESA